ncbi:rhomboid family intramembrane serine protease [bacterium]|jgi:membrane associated rhomboid family serine protease|nr:rhomboid family intramembrane serine protease [bacterium]
MPGTLTLILITTAAISWWCLQDALRKDQLMLKPFAVKHQQQWYRVLTHGFIHADSTHLFFNLFVLWQFGSSVETYLDTATAEPAIPIPGQYTFLMLYFGGLFTASLPAMYKHMNNPGYASLGASGAVSAVMMAYILYFPTAKLLLFFIVPMPAFVAGILFFFYESYMNRRGGTRIAHDAHLWGALFGVAFALAADGSALSRLFQSVTAIF